MDSNLQRWIKASVTDYFATFFDSSAFTVDGQIRRPTQPADRFELKLNGPDISERTASEYELSYDIRLLIISVRSSTDICKMERLKGQAVPAFAKTIPIYKYGSSPSDDQTLVGCLILRSNLSIRDFGTTDDTVYHTAIDAHYTFETS
jgi:hypothetical protein